MVHRKSACASSLGVTFSGSLAGHPASTSRNVEFCGSDAVNNVLRGRKSNIERWRKVSLARIDANERACTLAVRRTD